MSFRYTSIDDDLDDLDIMNDVISTIEPEANIVTFKDAKTAVSELLANRNLVPGYIFIDYNMPIMRGDACLEILRQVDHLKDSVIVMISTSMPDLTTFKLYQAIELQSEAGTERLVQAELLDNNPKAALDLIPRIEDEYWHSYFLILAL